MGRACGVCEGEEKGLQGCLGGNWKGLALIGRLAHRLDYNIKMNLNGIGWGGVDWMDLA